MQQSHGLLAIAKLLVLSANNVGQFVKVATKRAFSVIIIELAHDVMTITFLTADI